MHSFKRHSLLKHPSKNNDSFITVADPHLFHNDVPCQEIISQDMFENYTNSDGKRKTY